ncbi:MAG: putative ATP-dependent endonuclease of the OLD family [Parcubacteria group bacterium Athens0714_16]|nr:MAG: putative ATP-dependent endonuclease of the OLD family [Parcubacteria group bacterium Athens0714_16]
MYLRDFRIQNYRTVKDLILHFKKGLNILVGENNVGKTAIVDALRLSLGWGSLRRDIYFSKENDFHIDRTNPAQITNEVKFDLLFVIEDESETAIFREMLTIDEDNGETSLQLHIRYYLDVKGKLKYKIWGGENEGQQISNEVLQLINYVHLGALRDAEQFLKPFKDSKLSRLYSEIETYTEEQKKGLVKEIKTVLENENWKDFINKGKEKVCEHLDKTTFSDKTQKIEISFSGLGFAEILNNLHIQIPVFDKDILDKDPTYEQRYLSIWQNGLGYNNLIYIATVLGDIKQKKEKDSNSYFSLLIEEPEAHLHPQLQNLFFNYLSELSTNQNFQTFVSSHSPTITAKAGLDSLIVLQHISNETFALSVINSELNENNKKFLQKFLDVTKSQLFFANGTILVEGISESLLLPIFSKKIGINYFLNNLGIEVVNINGVAFEHFAKLFNSSDSQKRINHRCAVITDDDRKNINDDGSTRAGKVKTLETGLLKVFTGEMTFEYELFLASKYNQTLLLEIYKEFHPLTVITPDKDEKIYAKNFADKVDDQKSKSELAHRLAVRLENDQSAFDNFIIPKYIEKAIKYVAKNE